MKRTKEYLTLAWEFFRFGLFTFGGGWSIISQMQLLYVEKKKTLTAEELMDITGLGRSLPGTMIGNVAMLYGYRVLGVLGGAIAVISMITPPLVILIGISFCYDAFRTNYWVSAGMEGVQAAVAPIIASAAIGLVKGSIKNWISVAILAATVVLYLVFHVSVLNLVLFGIFSGLIIGEIVTRREAKNHGAA